jgi:Ca2+-binding RTX toxin-like protein
MATAITIHGGSGSDTINYSFVVTGTNTSRYAVGFANAVNTLLADGNPLTYVQSTGGDARDLGATLVPGAAVNIYDLIPSTVNGGANVFNIFEAGYVIDTISGNSVVNIGDGGDTVIVAGQNSQATVSAAHAGEHGNNDLIVFVSGDNTYIGDTYSGAGYGDTIVAGSGQDTISTGGGSATVNSGTGDATIFLNDTTTGSTINQYVWLDDGQSVIYANGQNDAVIATASGQTVYGNTSSTSGASSELSVVLAGSSTGDAVHAGAGGVAVYDYSAGGNTITGGTGGLVFVGGVNIADTILGGGGQTLIFGNSGENLTFANQVGVTSGLTELVAGAGSETLNGASAASNVALFASTVTGAGANDVLTGGYGNDTLVAGGGSDTLTGGAGANTFLLDAASDAGGNITIADFGASSTNVLEFGGYTPSEIASALASGTESNGNFSITLSDSTTVTFTGITGASELTGHIVTF